MLHYKYIQNLIQNHASFNESKEYKFFSIGVSGGLMEKGLFEKFNNINIVCADVNDYNPFSEEELKRITYYQCGSNKAVKKIKGKFDFIYIDGDHSYRQCLLDIINYMPLLRKDGIMAGHDYHPHWGVIQAVKDYFEDDFSLGKDLTWISHKKDMSEVKIQKLLKNIPEESTTKVVQKDPLNVIK